MFRSLPSLLLAGIVGGTLASCQGTQSQTQSADDDLLPIEHATLHETGNFYYVDFKDYQNPDATFPIGVFDSGTGGLTVLDALVRADSFQNASGRSGADGVVDFATEKFIYLADQANMPYGIYHSEKNTDLLVEHIIKDVQFLLGNKYYGDAKSESFLTDKEKVKAIVIACNTATAYGIDRIRDFVRKTGSNIPVIGVIDAGAKGVLEKFRLDESGTIGVFATVGTIASNGYEKTILTLKDALGYTGDIQIANQGGYGVAEAVDEVNDFINYKADKPRENYRGPSLENPEHQIDKTLLDIYNFNFDKNAMLCDTANPDECSILQLNSPENYVRYHIVSMLENMLEKENAQPLKALVLGCTHYPYLINELNSVFKELYHYKRDGEYRYRSVMSGEKIHLIDPSENVAKELYSYLKENNMHNPNGNINQSEFFISVPNVVNQDVKVDANGDFTYEYKYGRKAGQVQEYVRVVPFSKSNISSETLMRFEQMIPETFKLIKNFNHDHAKTKDLDPKLRIGE